MPTEGLHRWFNTLSQRIKNGLLQLWYKAEAPVHSIFNNKGNIQGTRMGLGCARVDEQELCALCILTQALSLKHVSFLAVTFWGRLILLEQLLFI